MSKYYYDIEGNEYEIVNREPTEEERKRAKESLEKEKEFMAYGPFDHPFKRVLLNDEHKYLNCYREFYHDRDEEGNPTESSLIRWYTKDGKYVGAYLYRGIINFIIKNEIQCDYKQDGDTICSIGYSEKNKTWYGWSHRGICGIKVGDVIDSPCHLAYAPDNVDDLLKMLNGFEVYRECYFEKLNDTTVIQKAKVVKLIGLNDTEAIMGTEWDSVIEYKIGLGLKKIETLEEAKQAAIIAAGNLN